MKEKRISIRFREDNEADMKAWKTLEKVADQKNVSKNAAALKLILDGADQCSNGYDDAFAERIAGIVVDKLKSQLAVTTAISEEVEHAKDEPIAVGEDALDFLDSFD